MEDNTEFTEDRVLESKAVYSSPASDYGEQGANGYDLSLFRANLRRTPTVRIERLQAAHNFFMEVKKARANRIPKVNRTDT
jgi:hypothetical protein